MLNSCIFNNNNPLDLTEKTLTYFCIVCLEAAVSFLEFTLQSKINFFITYLFTVKIVDNYIKVLSVSIYCRLCQINKFYLNGVKDHSIWLICWTFINSVAPLHYLVTLYCHLVEVLKTLNMRKWVVSCCFFFISNHRNSHKYKSHNIT